MHEIVPRLFLGNAGDAQRNPGFPAVLNATTDVPFFGMTRAVSTLRVPVMDNGLEQESLAPHLEGAVAFVRMHLRRSRPVLVHCAMGRQRSAAVVAAFLMRERGLSVDAAVAFVRARRPEAFLGGVNFRPSLDAYAGFIRRAA